MIATNPPGAATSVGATEGGAVVAIIMYYHYHDKYDQYDDRY